MLKYLTKPSQIDEKSKMFCLSQDQKYNSRVVQPKKPYHCLPLNTEMVTVKCLQAVEDIVTITTLYNLATRLVLCHKVATTL